MRRRYRQMKDGTLVDVTDAPSADMPVDSGALWGDESYRGLHATDGTPIDTRTKHRAYMRSRGITTVDDFAGEFKRASEARERFYRGAPDPTRAGDLTRALERYRG